MIDRCSCTVAIRSNLINSESWIYLNTVALLFIFAAIPALVQIGVHSFLYGCRLLLPFFLKKNCFLKKTQEAHLGSRCILEIETRAGTSGSYLRQNFLLISLTRDIFKPFEQSVLCHCFLF